MNKEFVTKNRQIEILKNKIISSWLIDEDILNDASKLYYDNPYHNFLHVLRVTSYVLLLNKNDFSPLEIRSLMIAWLFHDAGHTWTAMELDEFISLDHFRKTMDKYPDFVVDDIICRHWIIWTVFKNRAKNKNKYSKIMADLDIGDIWSWIADFIYYSSLFSLEEYVKPEYFYTEVEKGYFKYLMSIDKFVMISSEAREVLPNSLKTIREFYNIPLDKKLSMFETLKNEDITLDEFREKYFN